MKVKKFWKILKIQKYIIFSFSDYFYFLWIIFKKKINAQSKNATHSIHCQGRHECSSKHAPRCADGTAPAFRKSTLRML